jgi:hypothetical protein
MAGDPARLRIVLFGGALANAAGPAGPAGDTWEWNQGQWLQLQDVGPSARTGAKLAYDPDGGVTLLFGGSIDAGTWAWDGANWKEVADIGPGARQGHALSTSDGGVILFGGAAPQAEAPASRGDTWAWFDQSWRQIQDIGPAPRQRHAMAYDPTGAYRPLWRRDGGRSLRGRHLGTRPAQLTSLADKTQSSQLSA